MLSKKKKVKPFWETHNPITMYKQTRRDTLDPNFLQERSRIDTLRKKQKKQ